MKLTDKISIGLETYKEKFEGNIMLVPTEIPQKYIRIYDKNLKEIRYILSYLHYKFDEYITVANDRYQKRKTNPEDLTDNSFYYLSADSTNLKNLITDYHSIVELLSPVIIISIIPEYAPFIENMKDELKNIGGNTIYNYREYKKTDFEPIFKTKNLNAHGEIMNIIFASNGLKPEIILADALENKVKIVKHADKCLVYNREIINNNLTWSDLDEWWKEISNTKLSDRLISIYGGKGIEVIFLREYLNYCNKTNWLEYPALIPEVYLHYDPKTMKQLIIEKEEKRLIHQRMDFLMLINGNRIIIELDGIHHYSESGKPSSKKYADMVLYDRKMKLLGYDIYRFGGEEFKDVDFKNKLTKFFDELLKKYAPRLSRN